MTYITVFVSLLLLFFGIMTYLNAGDQGGVPALPSLSSQERRAESFQHSSVSEISSPSMDQETTWIPYEIREAHLGLQYPSYFKHLVAGKEQVIFYSNETSPWMVDVSFSPVSVKNLDEWIALENTTRPAKAPLRLTKKQSHEGGELAFFKIPIELDSPNASGVTMEEQDMAVFLHHGRLFRFTLRQQVQEPLVSDFFRMVQSIRILQSS